MYLLKVVAVNSKQSSSHHRSYHRLSEVSLFLKLPVEGEAPVKRSYLRVL